MKFPWQKKKEPKECFPPVPGWKPEFRPSYELLIDRFSYYSQGQIDFAILKNGTLVALDGGLDDDAAIQLTKKIMDAIYYDHPDMNPKPMDDGNILVSYNHPAYNIVLEEYVQRHWDEIDRNHQLALCTHEVFITPSGQNVFDDNAKKSLWARCYFFMDAQDFEVVKIVRNS